MMFLARATEYLTIPEATLLSILETIFEKLLELDSTYYYSGVQVLHQLIIANKIRYSLLHKRMNSIVHEALREEGSHGREIALLMLSARYSIIESAQAYAYARHDTIVWDTLVDAREGYKQSLLIAAKGSCFDAKMFISIYREGYGELFETHGFDVLFDRNDERITLDGISMGFYMLLSVFDEVMPGKKRYIAGWNLKGEDPYALVDSLHQFLFSFDSLDKLTNFLGDYKCFQEFDYIFDEGKFQSFATINRLSAKRITFVAQWLDLLMVFFVQLYGRKKAGGERIYRRTYGEMAQTLQHASRRVQSSGKVSIRRDTAFSALASLETLLKSSLDK